MKLSSLVYILSYPKFGLSFKARLNLFMFSFLQILIWPIVYLSKSKHEKIFWKLSRGLKIDFVCIENYKFKIRNVADFMILRADEGLSKYSKVGGVFIDVGGHIGKYSILLAPKFEKVLSLEASQENFSFLEENIEKNGLSDKVVPFNLAAFNADDISLNLGLSEDNSGNNSLVEKAGRKIESVKSVKLDTLVDRVGLNIFDISLIKIDVEGAELDVLKGMRNILENGNPEIYIEIWDNNPLKDDTKKFLTDCGYNLNQIEKDNYIAHK